MPIKTNRSPHRARLIALGAVTSVEFVENGMLMFAASQIAAGLRLSAEEFAFAYTLYGFGAIVMLYKHQWMAERLGYRRFILLSLACFALGCLSCATAGDLFQFAAGRLLQGLGGATFFTAGRMAVNDLPEDRRFTGVLVFVGTLLGASAVAPLLAVGLMEFGGWRALFWFGLPQTAAVAWISHAHLSRTVTPRNQRSTEHWGWLLWLATGIFCLQYAIQAIGVDASRPDAIMGAALGSVLVLAVFSWRQWHKDQPLIKVRSLAQPRYLLGLALYFVGYFLIGVSSLMVPILLHAVMGLSLLATAALTSGAMACTAAVAVGHIVLTKQRPRSRECMLAGLALYGAGCLLLASVDAPHGLMDMLPAILFMYVAIPLFVGPIAAGTFIEMSTDAFSHAYQVKNIIRQLGLSSSVAITTVTMHLLVREPERLSPLLAMTGVVVDAGSGGDSPLFLASRQLFAMMCVALVPAWCIVLVQRRFR